MHHQVSSFMKENKTLLLFIFLMFIFRSSIADWNTVPTGSMKPTILEGDRILVNKLAYDLNIPFTHISLKHISDPQRGDIVIFDSAQSGKRLVKRVIGIPGDTVSMLNNTIILNGKPLEYKRVSNRQNQIILEESLTQFPHKIRIETPIQNRFSSFIPVTIPENAYLVLGDNRNNSADSRYIGFVPRKEIIGRTKQVVMSLNYDNYYFPRPNRYFHKL